MTLSEREQAVCSEIARQQDDLVDLLRRLISFDTTTHLEGEPARDEEDLQRYLGAQLEARGAIVDIWEPDPGLIAGHPMVPQGFTFKGRPQLAARFAGDGGGPTLLLNGHVDVVDVKPRRAWSSDPFAGDVRDGALYGRGACDMKGGVASMVFAAEILAALNVRLAGDLIVNTVTDEESTGAGGLAIARTLRADAAIVTEPSGLDVLIACRGSLLPSITIEGRAAHAGIAPLHPDDGGPVNAIEKAMILLDAVRRLRDDWALRPRHPYLSPADCVPTMIGGGEWIVSYPGECRLELHIEYLPDQADEHGFGSRVEHEFEHWIAAAAAADPWLATHPPTVSWRIGGVPPAQVAADEPIVHELLAAGADVGRPGQRSGLDNWHDGASLILEAGIPAVCFGPGDVRLAHSINEHVPIADLVACAQAIAVTAMRYCGVRHEGAS